MKIVLLPQAQEDLDLVYEPLFSQIIHKLEILEEYPNLGATMGGPFTGYRSLVVNFFRIIYHLRENNLIEVVYIRDCRRIITLKSPRLLKKYL